MKETKICKKCLLEKSIEDFYRHEKMRDGHLNICKTCKRAYEILKNKEDRKDPKLVEKERIRGREKYHRLGYKPKIDKIQKNIIVTRYRSKYPEKYEALKASSHIKKEVGFHKHHWSYNECHFLDVIILKVEDHFKIHRYLKYDPISKMYMTLDNYLLDTKEEHLDYINNILKF